MVNIGTDGDVLFLIKAKDAIFFLLKDDSGSNFARTDGTEKERLKYMFFYLVLKERIFLFLSNQKKIQKYLIGIQKNFSINF